MNSTARVARAAQFAKPMKLDGDARKLLHDDPTPEVFVARLEEASRFGDALLFVAHWASKQAAVWWGCQCVWQLSRPEPLPAVEQAALVAATRWVIDPSEHNRRAAEAAGNAATMDRPAGGIALAAAWSGGSMSLPGLPEVAPPPLLTAHVVGKVVFAATQACGEQAEQQCRTFLTLGLQILHGQNLWKPRPGQAHVAAGPTRR